MFKATYTLYFTSKITQKLSRDMRFLGEALQNYMGCGGTRRKGIKPKER